MQVFAGLRIGLIISLVVFIGFFQLLGLIYLSNILFSKIPIELNAILVVNLVTSLGLMVQFVNYISIDFMKQDGPSRQIRAMKAMNKMGSVVLTAIAPTKLIGCLTLAFVKFELFRIYYFRVYFFIMILGVFNGLFFLPIILSWIGPPPDEIELLEKQMDEKVF